MSNQDRDTTRNDMKIGKAIIPGEWIWRIICFLLLVANLWVKNNYVSLDEYQKDKARTDESIQKIETLLTKMTVENQVNDRQEIQLSDHEARLRALEAAALKRR